MVNAVRIVSKKPDRHVSPVDALPEKVEGGGADLGSPIGRHVDSARLEGEYFVEIERADAAGADSWVKLTVSGGRRRTAFL